MTLTLSRDFAVCGVLGILRKENAPRVKGLTAFEAINIVRFRGSRMGAGYARFDFTNPSRHYKLGLFLIDKELLSDVIHEFESRGMNVERAELIADTGKILDYKLHVDVDNYELLEETIHEINYKLWISGKLGRVYYWSKYLEVYKGVGYPDDVAKLYNIYNLEGDLWLAHTRQPTNSPGYYPYWSHPFSAGNVAVVHNGDISSFGSNMNFLRYYANVKSFVGTDSEVVALIFHHLMKREKLDLKKIALIIANPPISEVSIEEQKLLYTYRGARLDGPYTLVIGVVANEDIYLIGIADRAKLRPVVLGEDENYYYVASEEAQIRWISPEAKVWTLKPGGFFIASMKRGIIELGRSLIDVELFFNETNREVIPKMIKKVNVHDRDVIDARGLSYKELNEKILEKALNGEKVIKVINVYGQRFIGVNLPRYGIKDITIELYGVPGNCLGNLNHGIEFIVYGDAEDDVGDTMHDGKIIIHGDARDVLGQTLQGGYIFVRGNAGNRVGIQMREYRHKRPYLIIGGRVDDYLGEYMAGGVLIVLGLNALFKNVNVEFTGNFVGTGMVGGRIFIRGKLSPSKIGLHPPREELLAFLSSLIEEGYLPQELAAETDLDLDAIKSKAKLLGNDYVLKLSKKIFEGGHIPRPVSEYRELNEEEVKELEPVLQEYVKYFNFNSDLVDELLSLKYTIIKRGEKK